MSADGGQAVKTAPLFFCAANDAMLMVR